MVDGGYILPVSFWISRTCFTAIKTRIRFLASAITQWRWSDKAAGSAPRHAMGQAQSTRPGSAKKKYHTEKEKLLVVDTQPTVRNDHHGHHKDCDGKVLKRSVSYLDEADGRAINVNPEDYVFPFENLVFEGGGNKGLAYVGVIQYLEEHHMLHQFKRFAGASAGAITSALVALGYSSKEIYDFLSDNIEEVFLDHSCGILSLLPNLLRDFGWNPGKKIHNWFGEKIAAKSPTNDPDMTFYELYKHTGVELCVVVTNLNCMRSEFCHPKTTPDMPLRDALRMTMAIPGVFSSVKYDNYGQEDIYVDGGVLCNYPIQCYDGWYLSMKKEDAFLTRMQPLSQLHNKMAASDRFGTNNAKTLGCLLYADTEDEVMRFTLEKRVGVLAPRQPKVNTPLFKQREKEKELKVKAEIEHRKQVRAVEAFMNALHKHNKTDWEHIDKDELTAALKDKEAFPVEHAEILFGEDMNDVDKVFQILDRDGSGEVAFMELLQFIEEQGVRMQTRFQGYGRREVKTFMQFLSALQNTLLTNVKFMFVKEEDELRTVGINTGHVGTSDYNLEDADREFVVQRGYNATSAFLKYFVAAHGDTIKKETQTLAPIVEMASSADEAPSVRKSDIEKKVE